MTLGLGALNWFDYVLAAVMIFSALIGMMRGLVREILSLLTWVAAFILAYIFTNDVAVLLVAYVKSQPISQIVGFFVIFVVVILVGSIINHIIGRIITFSGFSLSDAFFGLLFGAARGFLIALFIVFAVSQSSLSQYAWFNDSRLSYSMHDLSVLISEHIIQTSKDIVTGAQLPSIDLNKLKSKATNGMQKTKKQIQNAASQHAGVQY